MWAVEPVEPKSADGAKATVKLWALKQEIKHKEAIRPGYALWHREALSGEALYSHLPPTCLAGTSLLPYDEAMAQQFNRCSFLVRHGNSSCTPGVGVFLWA